VFDISNSRSLKLQREPRSLIQRELIWSIDKKGANLNVNLDVIVKIVRSTIPCHCGAISCKQVKESKVSPNLNHGFSKGMHGGRRSIVGPKVV